ncbi:circadian clock protein PASD1 [Eptesicus fuscus]|uniref:circadian clock protein PASD1 n=1 Tax=Eptesicus fuscus TaxID=29078 RepID=UPI00240461B6|nr:circadian clock protein PASD1 [Eptesicus fuscus]
MGKNEDVDTEQYESQESARTSGDISLTSPETTRSSTTTSSQNLEYEPPVEEGCTTVEVEPVQRMEEMEEEPLRISSPIAAYINKREKELVMRFKRKLEEKTQMLRADIRKQRKELKLMKEQLNTLKDSKFQVQPTMPYYISSDESQALEPAPKKQRTEQMEKSFSDTSETKSFHALCPPRSIRFSELFKEPGPFGPSTQIQSTDAPLQLAAEKQDTNIESQEEESQSFVPEDQQKQDMSPRTYSTDSDVLPASSSPSPVSSDSDISSLETTQDYIQLWHKTSDPNSHIKYEVRSWPCTDQDQGDGSEPRVSCYYSCHPVEVGQQELNPGEETQETSGLQAFQDTADDPSEKVSAYLSSDQSESDE